MNLLKFIAAVVLSMSAGLLGSLATFSSVATWYPTLNKPWFSPPNWIFGPVWTLLYIMMGIALYLVWEKGYAKKNVRFAFWLFVVHLGFNAAWSIVFFGLHSPPGGLVVILILWTLIVALIRKFYRIARAAAYLLVPYLAWVSFATVLNCAVWLLNR